MSTAPFGFLRVAAACPPVRVADPESNADATLEFVARAAAQKAQVLVLPELGLTGYTCGDLFFSLTTLVGGAERALERVLRETAGRGMVVVVGLPVLQGDRLFNAAAVLQSGRLLGVVPKTFLPGYKEYYEERWFSSAREAREGTLRLAGHEVPFGPDLLFRLPGEEAVTLAGSAAQPSIANDATFVVGFVRMVRGQLPEAADCLAEVGRSVRATGQPILGLRVGMYAALHAN